MMSSVMPSLRKSWLASGDRFLNGSTATEVRRAMRVGSARLATGAAWSAGAAVDDDSGGVKWLLGHTRIPRRISDTSPLAAAIGHKKRNPSRETFPPAVA